MRVAIITAFDAKYAPIADVTLQPMRDYAARHGYGLHVGLYREDPTDLRRYGDRGKIDQFLKLYDTHDIIMWLDVDVLITNQEIKIEDVLGKRPFIWSFDPNGPCSGFWIARCIPDVAVMFNKVENDAQTSRNVVVRELDLPHRVMIQVEPYGTSDQMCMRSLMHIPPYQDVLAYCYRGKKVGHCYDYRVMDWPKSYDYLGHWEPGDWLYTLPSVPLERRRILLERKRNAIYGPDYPRGAPGNGEPAAEPAAGEPAAADA